MQQTNVDALRPARKRGITAKDIGVETLLYSADEKAIHILNPAAKLIWELCDGEHTVADIERAVKASFAVGDEHSVAGDIQRTLEVLDSKGLLEKTA